jgi:hypothetical protein
MRQCHKRNAQLLVKHYNPDWNISLPAGGSVQYYLLPSRKAPVTPISVKNITFKNAAGNTAGAPLTIFKSFVSDDQEWQSALNINKTLFVALGNDQPASFTVQGDVFYNNQLFTNPPKTPVDQNWQRADAYINNYYFIVEGDEELSLNNDMIEVMMAAGGTGQSLAMGGTGGGNFPPTSLANTYLANFDYYSHKQDYINNGIKRPAGVTIANAVDITSNIGFLNDALTALLVPSGGDQSDQSDYQSFLFNPGGQSTVFAQKNTPALGSVLFTQVFKQDLATGAPANSNSKFLIRVAVLTDAWSYFKCRMRVKRNWRHLTGGTDPTNLPTNDINPVFTMSSAFSAWVDYGIQTFNIDYVESQRIGDTFSFFKYLNVGALLSIDDYLADPQHRLMPGLLTSTLQKAGSRVLYQNLAGNVNWPFEVVIYDRKGNNLLAQYTPQKPNQDINDFNKAYAEKNDLVIISKGTTNDLDLIVNPLSPNIKSYAPFIKVTWFSNVDHNVPVFSINWQLKFSNF